MSALNVVQITVNNEPIGIKPNSFKFKPGIGDRNVRTKMSGNNIDTVVSTDIETAKGMCSFTLLTEGDTIATVTTWQNNLDANVVVGQDTETGKTYTFTRAIIITDPEFGTGVDGETEIEFESSRVSQG
jgi:hypothetical protein